MPNDGKFKIQQILGQEFRFKCGHRVLLPDTLGNTNDYTIWNAKEGIARGGCWTCRICHDQKYNDSIKGIGPNALLVKARRLLNNAKCLARDRNYKPVDIDCYQLIKAWEVQNGICDGCKRPINWLIKNNCCIDHDHETGAFRAFLCHNCNLSEGFLKGYSSEEFANFCNYRNKYKGVS